MQYSFLTPNQNSILDVLDCVKVSDLLIIIWPTEDEILKKNINLLNILFKQGLPSMLHLTVGVPHNGKLRCQMRKSIEKSLSYWYKFLFTYIIKKVNKVFKIFKFLAFIIILL